MTTYRLRTIFLASLALFIGGVSVDALAESGRVVERGTNKPLAGVYVIAEWNGNIISPVQPHSVCYHADVTVTDSDGRFDIPAFSGNVSPVLFNRDRAVYAYKTGYKESPVDYLSETQLVMEPRKGTKAQQFDAVERRRLAPGCDEDKRKFLPVRKLRALELQSLAETNEQFEIADGALYVEDRIELGEDAAVVNKKTRVLERAAAKAKGGVQ